MWFTLSSLLTLDGLLSVTLSVSSKALYAPNGLAESEERSLNGFQLLCSLQT